MYDCAYEFIVCQTTSAASPGGGLTNFPSIRSTRPQHSNAFFIRMTHAAYPSSPASRSMPLGNMLGAFGGGCHEGNPPVGPVVLLVLVTSRRFKFQDGMDARGEVRDSRSGESQ